jgi:hypothetical protein
MLELVGSVIEELILDTNSGKTMVLSFHRCLINTGVEKMNYISIFSI